MHIVGCIEAHELSTCKQGANPHAHVILRKSRLDGDRSAADQPLTETTDMDAKDIAKAQASAVTSILAMNDVTKAHYLGLADDEARIVFLAKTADEQKAEAEAAKALADKTAEAEAAKAAGQTAAEATLQKSNDTLRAEVEALKAKDAERDIEKRAATEFSGYPGGVAAVVPLLKAYAALPIEARVASEAVLKAQCEMARQASQAFGARTEEDIGKAQTAAARIEKAAKDLAAEKKIEFGDAYAQITERADFAADVAAVNGGA